MDGGARKDFHIDLSSKPDESLSVQKPVLAGKGLLENEFITLRFNEDMQPISLTYAGTEMADGVFVRSAVNYADSRAAIRPMVNEYISPFCHFQWILIHWQPP